MPLITLPNPILASVALPVDFETDKDILRSLMYDMVETLGSGPTSGVGLAANQVGVLKRVILLGKSPYVPKAYFAINPSFKPVNNTAERNQKEGCLSDPGNRYDITRFNQIDVEYYSQDGQLIKARLSGLHSRIFQHEVDHLNGINIRDKS